MSHSSNFHKYYKRLSNSEILKILNNKKDYHEGAVEAAEKELLSRNLTETEIDEANKFLKDEDAQKEIRMEQQKRTTAKLKETLTPLIDTLTPDYSGKVSVEKNIRFIIIILIVLFIYQFTLYFNLYIAYLKDILAFPFESLSFLLMQLLIPVAIYLFWKRKKAGWILLIFYFILSSVFSIWSLIFYYGYNLSPLSYFLNSSSTALVIQTLFSIAMIYTICKENLREAFSINEAKMKRTINISVIIGIVLIALS